MGKRKPDRHKKKQFNLRLDERLRRQLEALSDRNASDLTAEITTAIREHLERAGLWPMPDAKIRKPPPA